VSGGVHRWFKRSTGKKRHVTRDKNNTKNYNNKKTKSNNNNSSAWNMTNYPQFVGLPINSYDVLITAVHIININYVKKCNNW
jgi:hypothetical protein